MIRKLIIGIILSSTLINSLAAYADPCNIVRQAGSCANFCKNNYEVPTNSCLRMCQEFCHM